MNPQPQPGDLGLKEAARRIYRLRHATRGEGHGAAKLTDQKVREMREMRERGDTFRYLAGRFGVGKTTVRDALAGRTWKHVR